MTSHFNGGLNVAAQRVRRGLLKGSLAVGFGAACDLWAAPKQLPAMHNYDEAQASLTKGRRLMADGNAKGLRSKGHACILSECFEGFPVPAEAVSAFSHVLTTAPLDSEPWAGYSLCMKALLGRRDAVSRPAEHRIWLPWPCALLLL